MRKQMDASIRFGLLRLTGHFSGWTRTWKLLHRVQGVAMEQKTVETVFWGLRLGASSLQEWNDNPKTQRMYMSHCLNS